MNKQLNIGLVGFGCVGSGLYEVLNRSALIDARIKRIVVKDTEKKRTIDRSFFSFEIDSILNDEEINVVVELINDSTAAYEIVKRALLKGKDVVTANKKMLAEHQTELIELARSNRVSLLYEGAVAGSIPIIRNLEEYYNNDSLASLEGIVNGTTNYILTQSNKGIPYSIALKEAKELGFAETDPTMDVDGFDSKFKLVLLLKHAFGLTLRPDKILNIGIRRIGVREIAYAREKGYRLKLFSRAKKIDDAVVAFVAPHFIEAGHAAYNVDDEFNAIVVEALFSDKQLFIGKGAGSHPTASAVLSDISALKFDYKYEYRKADDTNLLRFSTDFYIKVYIGSPFVQAINEVPFYAVDELFQSGDYNYQTGWVRIADLFSFNFNERSDLSLIVLPEPILTKRTLQTRSDSKLVSLETEML